MDQEAKQHNMNSNLEDNWDVDQVHETLNRVQFWNPKVCKQKNNLQAIKCLQWEWECKEKYGQGVHKDIMGKEGDLQ